MNEKKYIKEQVNEVYGMSELIQKLLLRLSIALIAKIKACLMKGTEVIIRREVGAIIFRWLKQGRINYSLLKLIKQKA
jgi:hypothetical protein